MARTTTESLVTLLFAVCLTGARAAAADCSCTPIDPAIEVLLAQGEAEKALPLAEKAVARSDSRAAHLCRARVLLSRAAREHVVVDEAALGLLPGETKTVTVLPEMVEKAFRSEPALNAELAAPGIAELERIVARWPSDPAAHRCLLEAHQILSDDATFSRVLERAAKQLAPLGAGSIDELLPWTSAYLERGELDRAEAAYRILVSAYPRSEKAQSGLGVVMIKRGRLDEAIRYFALAHELAPNDTIVLRNSLAAATYARDFPKARASCEKLLRVEPRSTDVHLKLAMLALADGPSAGIAGLERYLARHAEVPDDAGWAENARLMLEGLKRDGSTAQLESLASQLVRMGQAIDALPMLVGIVAREPKRAAPRFLLAQAYDVDGFDAIAFEELRGLEPLVSQPQGDSTPSVSSVHYEMGRLALHLGRASDSARYLQQSVAEDPERGDAHYTLGLALERLGRSDSALHAFESCIRAKRPSRYVEFCRRAVEKGAAPPPAARR